MNPRTGTAAVRILERLKKMGWKVKLYNDEKLWYIKIIKRKWPELMGAGHTFVEAVQKVAQRYNREWKLRQQKRRKDDRRDGKTPTTDVQGAGQREEKNHREHQSP